MSETLKPKPGGWIKSPDGVAEIYANTAHITWSLDDLRIRLGQLINSPDTPNPGPDLVSVSEERAAVTISWRGAKILRNQLTDIIDSYESVNGEIKIDIKLPPSKP